MRESGELKLTSLSSLSTWVNGATTEDSQVFAGEGGFCLGLPEFEMLKIQASDVQGQEAGVQ